MSTSSIITLAIIIGIVALLISIFNQLVALKNQYLNAFAQIEVQLKRRHDLVPNLVETAKAYLTHEKSTLEAVIAARNTAKSCLSSAEANNALSVAKLGEAERSLTSALGKLNVVVEDYPELKANENIMQLSEELSSTENRVGFARQAYNDSVLSYNTYRQSFPQNIFATTFGHSKDASLLKFEDAKAIQAAPKVSF